MKKYTFRKFFNDVHLWLGIGSGIILFIVCLTGTILTFDKEIIKLSDRAKYEVSVPAGGSPIAPDVLIASVEKELKGKVTAIEIPADKAEAYRLTVKKETKEGKGQNARSGNEGRAHMAAEGGPEGGKGGPDAQAKKGGGKPAGRGGRGTTYLVDPYTGKVQGSTESGVSKFFNTTMQLHRWLLVQGPGKIVVGVATIIFVFLVGTGLVLWWPRKRRALKQGLTVKMNAGWKRINHDLHNTLGFYSFILLLIMSLTGLCWSFEWYRDGLGSLLGDKIFKQRSEKPLPSDPLHAGTQKASLGAMIVSADELLTFEGNYRISIPADPEGSYVFSKSRVGFFAPSAADKVQFEQYTGEVLKVERFSEKPFNEMIAASIRSLHLGDVFGTFSKILYFIACLIATSLPVTGTIIWINKLKKKARKQKKRNARLVAA